MPLYQTRTIAGILEPVAQQVFVFIFEFVFVVVFVAAQVANFGTVNICIFICI